MAKRMAKRMAKKQKPLSLNEPLRHAAHKHPVTRRDFLAQGFTTGAGIVAGTSLLSLMTGITPARAAVSLSSDISTLKTACGLDTLGGGKIPFICFDLAGGANMVGSNILVGGQNGWQDSPMTSQGYSKMGIPGDMVPGQTETTDILNGPNQDTKTSNNDYVDETLGIAMHADSAYLRGILNKVDLTLTAPLVNGAVIPARSDNDTGNNPHNPMYGIYKCGANGELLTLIGSRSSESGGNSIAPADLIDPKVRPTKVDRPTDVTGLVDTGKLVQQLSQQDAVAVLESIQRLSDMKMGKMDTKLSASQDALVQELVQCGYVKSADLVARFGDPSALNPELDPDIVDITNSGNAIFDQSEFDSDGEFRKTASVMKMVIDGYAGAGTIQMGGFDYHTGERATGEARDLRAGKCIGACLEYARRKNTPVMIYVFSDGSLASNGSTDNSTGGRGKGQWTGDNSSTAASFFFVFNPNGRPQLLGADAIEQAQHQQIGWYRSDGSVDTAATPAANNVNLLVQTVLLNYLALHNEQGLFTGYFGSTLGNSSMMDSLTAFAPIVNGTIDNPV